MTAASIEFESEPRKIRVASFNPAYPWVYLPIDDWTHFRETFNEKFTPLAIYCDFQHCKFPRKTCEEVRSEALEHLGMDDFGVSFQIGDVDVKIRTEQMLVGASVI